MSDKEQNEIRERIRKNWDYLKENLENGLSFEPIEMKPWTEYSESISKIIEYLEINQRL